MDFWFLEIFFSKKDPLIQSDWLYSPLLFHLNSIINYLLFREKNFLLEHVWIWCIPTEKNSKATQNTIKNVLQVRALFSFPILKKRKYKLFDDGFSLLWVVFYHRFQREISLKHIFAET